MECYALGTSSPRMHVGDSLPQHVEGQASPVRCGSTGR